MKSRHADHHLDDAEVAALLTGEAAHLSSDARQHLESCPRCAAELERLSLALAAYRSEILDRAERPESHWLAQRMAVRARLDERARRSQLLLRWTLAASAGALLLVVAGGFWWGRVGWTPSRSTLPDAVATVETPATVTPAAAVTTMDPDAELLSRVEGAFARRTPDALAPAQALLDELSAPWNGGTS